MPLGQLALLLERRGRDGRSVCINRYLKRLGKIRIECEVQHCCNLEEPGMMGASTSEDNRWDPSLPVCGATIRYCAMSGVRAFIGSAILAARRFTRC